jgi:hypothetical protein
MATNNVLSKIVNYVVKNWSNLIILVIAVVGIIVDIFSNHQFGLESVILTVLALFAFSLMENSKKIDKAIDAFQSQNTAAEKYLEKSLCSEHLERIRKATNIDLMGVSFRDNLEVWYFILEERVKNGAKIRVLMMDVEDPNCLSAMSHRSGESEDLLIANYRFSINKLKVLNSEGKKGGSIELKLLKYPPSFGLILLNQSRLDGWGAIKVYSHDGVLDGVHPFFEIIKMRDDWWFNYFNHQFRNVWMSRESRNFGL